MNAHSAQRGALSFALAGMLGMAVAMGIGRFVYTPLLPGMMTGLGLSAADAGLIASANYVGYLVGALMAAGNWGQGRERVIAVSGLVATVLLVAAMASTSSLVAHVAIRFAAGLASAFVMVFLTTIVFARLAGLGRSDLQAWHFGGVGLGIAASSLMTGVVAGGDHGWQTGWLAAACMAALAFAVVLVLLGKPSVAAARAAPEPPIPRSHALTRIIVAYGLFGFGYIVTATFLIAIVRESEGSASFEAAVWFVTGLAGLPSVWLWNRIARRIGVATAYAVGCVVEALGVAASVTVGGAAGPLLAGVLLGGTFIAVTALGLQLGRQLAGDAPRRALALMTAAFGVGQILGPLVAGMVADRTGSFTAPSLLAAAVLFASAAIGWSARPSR